MTQANPFKFDTWTSAENFCNRIQETEELKRNVDAGTNVLLYAPRRYGKTSLLKLIEKKLSSSWGYRVIYLDLFSITSPSEFIEQYFSAAINALPSPREKAQELLQGILQIRPQVNMTLRPDSGTTYTLTFNRSEQDMALNDVLQLPQRYASKRPDKVLVIFDEFQEVQALGLEDKLNSVLQGHERDVSYIFCLRGGKQSLLPKMFNDNARNFYHSAKRLYIGAIELAHWQQFITDKFARTGKSIEQDAIKLIVDLTQGLPYYTQQLCYTAWECSGYMVNTESIDEAMRLSLAREINLYSALWSDLTPKQRRTLKYLVRFGGNAVYSGSNLSAYDFNASTLKSTLESLQKKDLIDRNGTQYYLTDPFMEHWVRGLG